MTKEETGIDRKRRREIIAGLGAAGVVPLAGCGGSSSGGGDDGAESGVKGSTSTNGGNESGPAANVGMVYALGGLGDKSFNDMAHRGAQKARLDLDIEFTNAEPGSQSDIKPKQKQLAESTDPDFDLVCCIGFLQAKPLKSVAPNHSDQQFTIVDTAVEKDNVASYVFKEHEGSFQIGHLAGLLTTKDLSAGAGTTKSSKTTVGFVGGLEIPPIKKFEAGYKAGVAHANENVEVLTEYVGGFNDVKGGKKAANGMYDKGADIIYHAAGGTGVGVFQAAQSRGRFAIGVDSDQSRSNPKYGDVILASMVKRVNNAVFTSIENVVNGSFNGGNAVSLGLERKGVEVVYGNSLGSSIPSSVTSALKQSRESVISGEISVPTSP